MKKIPGLNTIHRLIKMAADSSHEPYPRGHFYSPLPDIKWVEMHAETLFKKNIEINNSIDLNETSQYSLLVDLIAYCSDFKIEVNIGSENRYYSNNEMFGYGSAFSLYSILRHFRPSHVIEIGSGFSSALMLDVNDHCLNKEISFTFIEPHPRRLYSLLKCEDHDTYKIYNTYVQNVDPLIFQSLDINDILFIDSSHISKIGSDVNYLLFEVIPHLNSGVIIHFHDIYWPFEYPQHWIANGLAWNEAYLVRAFLQYNDYFEILQFNSYLAYRFEHFYKQHLPEVLRDPGSSLWLRKK